MPTTTRQNKMLPGKLAALLVALKEGEYNSQELADIADLHYLTVLDYCRALHSAGLVFICKYDKDALGRFSILIYKLGEGKDVPRPTITRAEQQRNYRKRREIRERERQAEAQQVYVHPALRVRRRREQVPGPVAVEPHEGETMSAYLQRVSTSPPVPPSLAPPPPEEPASETVSHGPVITQRMINAALERLYGGATTINMNHTAVAPPTTPTQEGEPDDIQL